MLENDLAREEVQTRSQAQIQGQNQQGNQPPF